MWIEVWVFEFKLVGVVGTGSPLALQEWLLHLIVMRDA